MYDSRCVCCLSLHTANAGSIAGGIRRQPLLLLLPVPTLTLAHGACSCGEVGQAGRMQRVESAVASAVARRPTRMQLQPTRNHPSQRRDWRMGKAAKGALAIQRLSLGGRQA